MNTGLDQYMDIFKDAVDDSAAKISIIFQKYGWRYRVFCEPVDLLCGEYEVKLQI